MWRDIYEGITRTIWTVLNFKWVAVKEISIGKVKIDLLLIKEK